MPFNAIELLMRSPFWAIRPEAAAQAILSAKIGPSGWEAAKPSFRGPSAHKIAVIPVQGVLSKDGPSWYGSSYDNISRHIEEAAADPDVAHIVIPVDSPGGYTVGCEEAAATIAAAAKIKPVTALVEGQACSAAYWLASQANHIVSTPSGEVGSVGVRMTHFDISKMLENDGVKVTELYSGDHKTEWSPFSELSQEAIDDMNPRLQDSHAKFIAAVTSGRGDRVTPDIKAKRFGEGRIFDASVAQAHGLVDSLQTPSDFYRSITTKPEPKDAPKFSAEDERLRDSIVRAKVSHRV